MRKKMANQNLLERGLGKDVNLAIITALLSLVVSFTTSMIISKAECRDELKKDKQNTEREALKNLQRSVLKITDAAVDVADQKLPARFPTLHGIESPTNKYL
jgi:mannitol-specific phosphotransferase system IIBC component